VPKPDVKEGLSGLTLPALVAVLEKAMLSALVITQEEAQTVSDALNARVTEAPSVPSATLENT